MRSLWLLLSLLLCLPASAFAQDEDEDLEDEDLEDEEPVDPDVDDRATYDEWKAEVANETPSEELDAWGRYLDAYPKSLFRLEIERRMAALEDAAHNELLQEEARDAARAATKRDAKSEELYVPETGLMGVNPNPLRRIDIGLLWGFNNVINFDLNFEWAFLRKLSAWGGIRHVGAGGGDLGINVQIGAKYALIKDVRTGIVLTGYFAIEPGFSQSDNFRFALQPGIGFAYAKNDRFQFATTLQMDASLSNLGTTVTWDAMATVNPNKVLGIYLESKQRHGLFDPSLSANVEYMAFFQAGMGVKVRPNQLLELTVGANVPYFWRYWKDYRYVGIHANVVFKLPSKPKK
jgi:hypothetical protein